MKKNFTLLCLLFFALVIASCKKDVPDCCAMPAQPYLKTNDNSFSAVPATGYNSRTNKDTLVIVATNTVKSDQNVGFQFKFVSEGNYKLTGNQAYYYTTIGGDVISARYKLDESANNLVAVTKYEKGAVGTYSDVLTGTFKLAFVNIDQPAQKLNFEGTFQVTPTANYISLMHF